MAIIMAKEEKMGPAAEIVMTLEALAHGISVEVSVKRGHTWLIASDSWQQAVAEHPPIQQLELCMLKHIGTNKAALHARTIYEGNFFKGSVRLY